MIYPEASLLALQVAAFFLFHMVNSLCVHIPGVFFYSYKVPVLLDWGPTLTTFLYLFKGSVSKFSP